MKKPYSLDYSIERDIDRADAVAKILDTLPRDPNESDLEQMASYILYGKDESGLNAVKRGEITDSNTRYSSYRRKADKAKSLEEMLANPMTDEREFDKREFKDRYIQKRRTIERPKYDKKTGELIDPGDSDIPGMVDLWDSIDKLDKWIAQLEGKLPATPERELFEDDYRLYRLKHTLIDMRRHQYYLKDSYKPVLQLLIPTHPKTQFYDWTTDSFYWLPYEKWRTRVNNSYRPVSKDLRAYETRGSLDQGNLEVKWIVRRHTFDWTNYKHVRALISLYHDLDQQLHNKLDTYGRTLLWDLDRYIDLTDFAPLRRYLIDCRKAGMEYSDILELLESDWGIQYNKNHLSDIFAIEIPKKIVETVRKQQLLCDIPQEEWKQCFHCGKKFPRSPLFFGRNAGRRDGWSSNCKVCERLRRIEKGGQDMNDRRTKNAQMCEM